MTDVVGQTVSPSSGGLQVSGWDEDFSVSCPRLEPAEYVVRSGDVIYRRRSLVGIARIHAYPGIHSEFAGERRKHRIAKVTIRQRHASSEARRENGRGEAAALTFNGANHAVTVQLTIELEDGHFDEIWGEGPVCLSEATLRLNTQECDPVDSGSPPSFVTLHGEASTLCFFTAGPASGVEIDLRSALEQEATQRLHHVSLREGVWGQVWSVTAELGTSLSGIRDLSRYYELIAELRELLLKAREVFHEADFVQIAGESKNVYALAPSDFSNYLTSKEPAEKRKLELSYQEFWSWHDIGKVIDEGEAVAGPQAHGFKCAQGQIESLVTTYLRLGVRSRTLERVFLSSLCYSSCLAYARALHAKSKSDLLFGAVTMPIPSLSARQKIFRALTSLAKTVGLDVVLLLVTFSMAWIVTGQNTVAAWIVTVGYTGFRWIRHILLAKFRQEVVWELRLRELSAVLRAFNDDEYNPREIRARVYKIIQTGGSISPRLLDLLDLQVRGESVKVD